MTIRLKGIVTLALAASLLVSLAAPTMAALVIQGLIEADGYEDFESSSTHMIFKGGSPQVIWIDQATNDRITVRSAEITVHWRAGEKDSPSALLGRVTLKGQKSTVVSTQRGFSIEASEITVIAPEVKGQGAIETASAVGDVRLTYAQGDVTGGASADTLEIKDGGDTAILTGSAVMNYANPQYPGGGMRLTGDLITITEILPREGKPFDPVIRAQQRPKSSD